MLKIHNSLTRDKVEFKPMQAGKISMYACGVTVYDYCHLGHARTYTAIDVIIRYLRFRGYQVNTVRNITDIDDKIIKRANEKNEAYDVLTERFIQAMHEDFNALGLMPPDHEPRATEYIPQMIALIEKIIANDQAYVASNGDVYFDVRKFSKYGCLSHHNIEELEQGARVDIVEAKRDPLDFVLWKLAKPNEPSWDSPWGKGRPGWHIECSTMAMDLLGASFDIHAGGRDLIFPHHENEIAQSESVTHQDFAKVWMHTGFLQIDKEKMSKSLGNFITIREALADHHPEVLRYFLLANHYRSPLVYTDDALFQAKQSLDRLYTALRASSSLRGGRQPDEAIQSTHEAAFIAAMDDDFNVPIALSVLFELAHEVQRTRDTEPEVAAAHVMLLKKLGNVLGMLTTDPDVYFQSGADVDVAKIEALITARNAARASKNWAEADRVRAELSAMGIQIEDGAAGTTWKR